MSFTKEILELERRMSGPRLELFQEAFDVLHDSKNQDSDIQWRISNLPYLVRGFNRVNMESPNNYNLPQGTLYAKVISSGLEQRLGLISVNKVTQVGVAYIVDAMQGSATITNLKYHGSGTSNTAESNGDTTLGTEVGSRSTGTTTEGASANVYRSVATLSYGSSYTIVEHGLFSAVSSGTLFDRSVFAGISAGTTVSIEFTYDWTLNYEA